ncbi:MAG: DUF4091 domain-containing protein [Candidatus Hydrogenedentes bacterium]|nr:DUF4091 domain-containing protein [Candidatus Hydrogenedentota bacterium]
MNARRSMAVAAVLAVSLASWGATPLFDFESADDLAAWTLRTPGQDTFTRERMYATSGEWAAVFRTPEWRQGMQGWPAFEVRPPVTDWTGARTLLIDFANPTGRIESVSLFFTDSKTPFRSGARARFTLRARSYTRALIPLDTFPASIDRSDMALIHFYVAMPQADYALYLDTVALLGPDEAPPPYPEAYVQQIGRLLLDEEPFRQAEKAIRQARGRVKRMGRDGTAARASFEEQLDAMAARCDRLHTDARASGTSVERIEAIRLELSRIRQGSGRLAALAPFYGLWHRRTGISEYAAGFATSMEKVLPQDIAPPIRIADRVPLDLAQNESESTQLVVLPLGTDLSGVRVEMDGLAPAEGGAGAAPRVDVRVVGYVKTAVPPYEVPYVGWWPDPLLDFLERVDVADGNAQAFWIRVRTERDTPPGLYRATGRVVADNAPPWTFGLDVTVHGFAMPDRSPLPTAISLYTNFIEKHAGENWDAVRVELADFLADYYIDYDSLYRGGPPDFEILKRLDAQGRLVAFNLRYFSRNSFPATTDDPSFQPKLDALCANVKAIYKQAQEAGIADKAYCYGFDECRPETFPVLQAIAAALKQAIPGVPIMTTSYDQSFGLDSCVTAMDAWVPLTPSYDVEQAAAARKQGKQVWWYICVGPRHPYANWFIEYPAIETRLLMGAMTAKYRPDGFLYYTISRWPGNEGPITDGPFTSWNPASFNDNNGDGSLFCPGPGGRPLATVRLENFRDGLEDYAYARHLEALVAAGRARWDSLDGRRRRAVRRGGKALAVPKRVVRSMTEFTQRPEALYEYRSAMTAAIEELSHALADAPERK